MAPWYPLAVERETGHVLAAGPPQMRRQYLNSCGHWVYADANFCQECLVPADVPGGDPRWRRPKE